MLTTEQLKEQFAKMEELEIPRYSCGRYRIATEEGLYWLNKDGSLELIYKYSKVQDKPTWMKLNSKANDTQDR